MKFSWTEWLPLRSWRVVGVTADADEIPDRLPPKGVVLIGSMERPKWVAFDCPCGAGHRIVLNADSARRPFWQVEVRKRRVTLIPSIDYVGGRQRCHYFVRDGRIDWLGGDHSGWRARRR